ncbi:MAG TPA: tetratricopeptide repeat protein [Phycisphaerae bacterium]|nr:tetratricopeptide repeat protein [Phycisphaerae bacterium]HNU46279.1 tetratricopeptide repeat protein [Phycisphaerae bacterium]
MTGVTPKRNACTPPRFLRPAGLVVGLAALAMGLPTIGGGFVGGDDYQLALNHVLVNHPSWSHALALFKIVHRDLYQPLPLLSFSGEFWLAYRLDLFDPRDPQSGAWLFHLTNILLHAANAVLVWRLLRCLSRDERVALIGGLLFALHPLQVEVVAWINGRMMLMSTLFAVAALLTWARFLEHGGWRWAGLTLLFVLACGASKVRVELPVLLLMVPLARGLRIRDLLGLPAGKRPTEGGTAVASPLTLPSPPGGRGSLPGMPRSTRRLWLAWAVYAAVTGAFAVVNIWSTAEAEMFAGGAEHLHGPRVVRVLLSLAWYVQHFVWPRGLAAWYHAPPVVYWADLLTTPTLLVLVPAAIGLTWAAWRWLGVRLGVLWFCAAIAATLPIVPARNILAADRYMYLPIIGLLWASAVMLRAAHARWFEHAASTARRFVPRVAGLALLVAALLTSWHVGSFYDSAILKTTRIAQLNPDLPQVYERMAWAYYNAGKAAETAGDAAGAEQYYVQAIDLARRELPRADVILEGKVYQLVGLAEWRRGRLAEAEAALTQALDTDPRNPLAYYRLAHFFEEAGRIAEALPLYETAVTLAPTNNPVLIRLADLYRRVGRLADARAVYEQALQSNPYEVPASLGLAELDLGLGTTAAAQAAADRLERLLDWMPEHSAARVNLGVAYQTLGRTADALAVYEEALRRDPQAVTAALNRALIYHAAFLENGRFEPCVALWADVLTRFPGCVEARAYLAWSQALAGLPAPAVQAANALLSEVVAAPLAHGTLALVALRGRRHDDAVAHVEAVCATGPAGAEARRQLLFALGFTQEQRPELPWTYCLAARLLLAGGQVDIARQMLELGADAISTSPPCRAYADDLRAQLPAAP